jgi:hypothetical protein
MKNRLSSERGNVVVTAVLMIAIMLAVGLAALSQVDTQQAQSRTERVSESSFNLGEAALTTQIYILGRKGTGTASKPYPDICPTAGNDFCPDPAKVALNYQQSQQPDYDPSETVWRTWVRDNASSTSGTPDTFWRDDLLDSRPRYDQNADKLMWVRAQANVRGRERAMVGLIRIEPRPVTFPAYAILSGKFRTTNNGNHSAQIVNTTGSLGVTVRCNGTIPSTNCIEYEPNKGQILPNNVKTGYTQDETVSLDDLEALLDVARANGTYYTSCPTSLTGDVVALDPGNGTECAFQGNTQHNSAANPGLLIVVSGRLEFRGTTIYHGLVYHPNLTDANDFDLIKVHGNSQVNGGVIVDGKHGGISAGSSGKLNINFNANAFNDINSFGTAGVVQNTWREITPLDLG